MNKTRLLLIVWLSAMGLSLISGLFNESTVIVFYYINLLYSILGTIILPLIGYQILNNLKGGKNE